MQASFFKAIDTVVHLTAHEKELLLPLFELVQLDKHEFLLKEGEICRYDYFITDGITRTFYTDETGGEHTSMFAFPGWWTGDLVSLQKKIPTKNYIQALDQSTVLRISLGNQIRMFELVPKLEKYFRVLFQNRVVALEEAMEARQSLRAIDLYHNFTKKHGAYMQQIPLKHLASYLNITPPYLSRIRSQKKYRKLY